MSDLLTRFQSLAGQDENALLQRFQSLGQQDELLTRFQNAAKGIKTESLQPQQNELPVETNFPTIPKKKSFGDFVNDVGDLLSIEGKRSAQNYVRDFEVGVAVLDTFPEVLRQTLKGFSEIAKGKKDVQLLTPTVLNTFKKITTPGAVFGESNGKPVPKEQRFTTFMEVFKDIGIPEGKKIPEEFEDIPDEAIGTLPPIWGMFLKLLKETAGLSVRDAAGFATEMAIPISPISAEVKALKGGTEAAESLVKSVAKKEVKEVAEKAVNEAVKDAPEKIVKQAETKIDDISEQATKDLEDALKKPVDKPLGPPEAPDIVKPVVTEEKPGMITSARQADINTDRELIDLNTLNSPERKSWRAAINNAQQKGYDKDFLERADDLLKNPRAMSDDETAGMTLGLAGLKKEHVDTFIKLKTADDVDVGLLTAKLERIEEQFDKVSQAMFRSGTEKGRALASQKLTINDDFELISTLTRAKAKKGSPLTPKQKAKFTQQTNELEKLGTKTKKLEADINEEVANKILKSSDYKKMSVQEIEQRLSENISKAKALIEQGCTIHG